MPASNAFVLRVTNLAKRYGQGCPSCYALTGPAFATNICPRCGSIVACHDIGFDLEEGEILGIVGESGSGKSTLVRCLYFDEEVTGGEAFLAAYGKGGVNLFAESSQRKRFIRNHLMGMVYQNPLLGIKPHFTAGGNVAENAECPRCVKYGVTKDFMMGLELVLPTGEIIRTGTETYKAVVGYDLTRLLCGSEGTLGVITKIIFKLLPLPEAKKTMLTIFDSIDGAARAVSTIIGAKIIPTTLEFMDYATLQCVEKRFNLGIPPEGRAVLLIEVDGDRELIEKQAARIHELIKPLGLVQFRAAKDNAESEALWKVRRLVSPSLRDVNPHKFNEDIVVPRSKVPVVIRQIEKIQQKYDIPIVNFGHAGDGNIHVNVMINKEIAGQEEKAHEAIKEIFQAALDLNGTMSGEHGVGLAKQPYIEMELTPAQIKTMQGIKLALDPNNILNPGKIFPWKDTPHAA